MTRAQAITTLGLVHIYRSEGQDVAALSGVDLSVAAGEVVGLLGPSGSGKSTLLSLLGGLFRPSAGKIFVGEHELSALTPTQLDAFQARETSLMLQGAQRNLIPYLTVRENIAFAQVEARRLGADVIGVDRGLELVGATEFADAKLGRLSQGQMQMAALAVAMAPSPGVLLADEPTSALDRGARERILDTLLRVNEEQGTTVVVVTHDPEVADRLPRTVTIRDGRIGGEGRSGKEYAVVTADGFIPIPVHIRDQLPPGTLLRIDREEGGYLIVPEVIGQDPRVGVEGLDRSPSRSSDASQRSTSAGQRNSRIGTSSEVAHARISARFRANERKCQTTIESRERVPLSDSTFPLQIGRRSTSRMRVRRTSRVRDRQRG